MPSTSSCTVTSSADVGSSAISSSGPAISIMAIMARWPMPPETSCGWRSKTRRGSRICTASSMASARSRASALADVLMRAQRLDDLPADAHHRIERVFRILQDHGDAVAAQVAAQFRRRASSRSMPSKFELVLAETTRVRRRQPHDRAAGLRLARAAFADDAQPLAAEREGNAAHRLDHAGARRKA